MLMLTDESTRKPPNSQIAKPFICEKCGKSYRKQKFYEIHVKHDECKCFVTSDCWMCCVGNLNYFMEGLLILTHIILTVVKIKFSTTN